MIPDEERVGRWSVPTWNEESETPSQQPTLADMASEGGGTAIELLKQHWKKIAIGIFVLGVVFGVYNYFIGSISEVEISAKDIDGKTLNAAFKVYAEGSAQPVERFNNKKVVQLRHGTYNIEAAAPGYKADTLPCVVDATTKECSIQLEKISNVKLTVELPEILLTGIENKGKVILENKGQIEETVTLEFVGAFANKNIGIEAEETVTVPPMQIVQNDFTVTPDKTEGKNADYVEGIVKIKQTKISSPVKFKIINFDSGKVSIGVSKLDFGRISAGSEPETKDVRITNNNKEMTMENIEFEIVDLTSEKTQQTEPKTWIKFIPEKIEALEAGASNAQTVAARLSVPINAYTDKIEGRVKIKNNYWEKVIPFSFVVEAKEAEIIIEGVNDKYLLAKDSATGAYKSETDLITIRNKGALAVENVQIALKDCDSTWAEMLGATRYDMIKAGDKVSDTRIEVRASSTTQSDTVQICTLGVLFTDPVNPLGESKKLTKTFEIRTG